MLFILFLGYSFIISDLDRCRIGRQHLVHTEDQEGPLTICILNQQNGSRTIMHTNRSVEVISLQQVSVIDEIVLKAY